MLLWMSLMRARFTLLGFQTYSSQPCSGQGGKADRADRTKTTVYCDVLGGSSGMPLVEQRRIGHAGSKRHRAMRILALETTDKIGSVAAMADDNPLAELMLDHSQRSAQSLLPAVDCPARASRLAAGRRSVGRRFRRAGLLHRTAGRRDGRQGVRLRGRRRGLGRQHVGSHRRQLPRHAMQTKSRSSSTPNAARLSCSRSSARPTAASSPPAPRNSWTPTSGWPGCKRALALHWGVGSGANGSVGAGTERGGRRRLSARRLPPREPPTTSSVPFP